MDGVEVARPCHCQEKARLSRRLAFANLPEAFKDRRLSSFHMGAYKNIEGRNYAALACKTVKFYIDNFEEMQERGMGLYMFSQTKGSGKTTMAAGIANELMEMGHQVKFATSLDIVKEIKRTWEREKDWNNQRDGERQSEGQLLDALGRTEILIIDDFGVEIEKDWIKEKYFQIVNDRYINKKITIFTSNDRLEDLKHDDRVINRIKEITYQLQFPEESIRDYIAEDNRRELIEHLKAK